MTDTMLKQARFSIAGMRCGGCAISLEKRLRQTPGISSARVNATTHGLVVQFDDARLSAREIEAIVDEAGFAAHPDSSEAANPGEKAGVLIELAVAGFGMMNVMLFSISVWAGLTTDMGEATVQFMNWAAAALATPVVLFSARPFFRPAIASVAAGRMTMDVAISFAILGTYVASFMQVLSGAVHVYFDAAIALTFFLLIGRQLDHVLRRKSSVAVNTLRGLIKPECQRLTGSGTTEWVEVAALRKGDVVLVPKGERSPADGVLASSSAQFDESVLTGESDAALKREGDNVCAAGLNLGDPCRVRVTSSGADTSLEKISRLVELASSEKSGRQLLADRFAASYGPFVLVSSVLTFLTWYLVFGANLHSAFEIAVAVLVVTCPCAAGLATPAVAARASNLLLEKGVIVKSGAALEELALADQFVCDKTGTLSVLSSTSERASGKAVSLASASTHPAARALASGSAPVPAPVAREFPGEGIEDDAGNRLGSARFTGVADTVVAGPELWFKDAEGQATRMALHEQPRAGLSEFLGTLDRDDVDCMLLSGDRESNVARFARDQGIEVAVGECKPDEKLLRIKALQQEGKVVAMLGDGLNDAAAMSQADVSLSFSEASETARNAADIVVLGSSLSAVPLTRRVAREARRRMTENLTFAALYNVVTVPIAVAGLLTPFWAAIFMSSSSVLVMLNACRLSSSK